MNAFVLFCWCKWFLLSLLNYFHNIQKIFSFTLLVLSYLSKGQGVVSKVLTMVLSHQLRLNHDKRKEEKHL